LVNELRSINLLSEENLKHLKLNNKIKFKKQKHNMKQILVLLLATASQALNIKQIKDISAKAQLH